MSFGPDTFTVGTTTNIDAYPAVSPNNDYAYNNGSGGDVVAEEANDRVQIVSTTITILVRIVDPSVANGVELPVEADCFSDTLFNSTGVAARVEPGGTNNAYFTYFEDDAANECRLLRTDGGSEVLIDSVDASLVGGSARLHSLVAKGTGATVTLTWNIAGMAVPRSIGDSAANRKTTGGPGFAGFNSVANSVWLDNLLVRFSRVPDPSRTLRLIGAGL